ncbi:hypothetical protein L914_10551 [Phytophthora nicotianae]|uniref:Uncharacterized protein n=3 Tax=Phytophthora nicotianae TaxID=4792 RepID=V9EZM3_PHYNI|nr:hypothetical protein F443_10997 [Phytophthora nicotianae P1569]ETL37749.1 hypothetical protein L916_10609 [Phytophthora nicotianae]ETM44195.1 hypothetical protein L914_10551 [Phytophthora nicotianae]ETO72953.1 hypothetical protein F444_11067 [Phytophthora nicotianae P1976]
MRTRCATQMGFTGRIVVPVVLSPGIHVAVRATATSNATPSISR